MGILFPPFPTKKQSKVRFAMNIKKTALFAAAAAIFGAAALALAVVRRRK